MASSVPILEEHSKNMNIVNKIVLIFHSFSPAFVRSGILIIVQQVKLIMFSFNMLDYLKSFLSLFTSIIFVDKLRGPMKVPSQLGSFYVWAKQAKRGHENNEV